MLELLAEFKPHMAILELLMPGMDGLQVARHSRMLTDNPDLVLVALSGWTPSLFTQDWKAAGFDYYLLKPVGVDALEGLLTAVSLRNSEV